MTITSLAPPDPIPREEAKPRIARRAATAGFGAVAALLIGGVAQEIHGHRGRKNDPLYRIRTILCCGVEKLTDRQRARLDQTIAADERHDEVYVAWQCAQRLRSAYQAENPAEGSTDRRAGPRLLPDLSDPRDQETRQDAQTVPCSVPGLLRHRPSLQRRHRGHQRTHRAPPPHRPRLPQPRLKQSLFHEPEAHAKTAASRAHPEVTVRDHHPSPGGSSSHTSRFVTDCKPVALSTRTARGDARCGGRQRTPFPRLAAVTGQRRGSG